MVLQDLNFDLKDVTSWEHLLVAEPWNWRQLKKDSDPPDDRDWALMEKHLDMSASWVQYLKIPYYSKMAQFKTLILLCNT